MQLTELGADKNGSEEHTSELQSHVRISYAVFCLKKKKQLQTKIIPTSNANQSINLDCKYYDYLIIIKFVLKC